MDSMATPTTILELASSELKYFSSNLAAYFTTFPGLQALHTRPKEIAYSSETMELLSFKPEKQALISLEPNAESSVGFCKTSKEMDLADPTLEGKPTDLLEAIIILSTASGNKFASHNPISAVSYTHLDVYKRQGVYRRRGITRLPSHTPFT